MTKEEIKKKQQLLIDMTNEFCLEKIDEEYAFLCEKLIKKLGRKRDVPFKSGRLNIWAASIIHAIGTINFLFDQSFEPYIEIQDIHDYFETKKSTVSAKSNQIRKLLDMYHFDSEFSTQEIEDTDPMNNMVMVDGFIVPLSSLSEELQEIVKQERAQGRDIEFTSSE